VDVQDEGIPLRDDRLPKDVVLHGSVFIGLQGDLVAVETRLLQLHGIGEKGAAAGKRESVLPRYSPSRKKIALAAAGSRLSASMVIVKGSPAETRAGMVMDRAVTSFCPCSVLRGTTDTGRAGTPRRRSLSDPLFSLPSDRRTILRSPWDGRRERACLNALSMSVALLSGRDRIGKRTAPASGAAATRGVEPKSTRPALSSLPMCRAASSAQRTAVSRSIVGTLPDESTRNMRERELPFP
jgi:hypothetical protein